MREIDGISGCGKGAGSSVLEAGLGVIGEMRRTVGSGEPERGEAFRQGAQRFREAGDLIAAAQPRDWSGPGAAAYGHANQRHSHRVTAVAALDHAAHVVLDRQADQILYQRHAIDDQADRLARLSRTSRDITTAPGVGAALKATFEMAAVACALDACREALDGLVQQVGANTDDLRGIAAEYAALADDGPLPHDVLSEQDADAPERDEHHPARDERDPVDEGAQDNADPRAETPTVIAAAGPPTAPSAAVSAASDPPPAAVPAEAMSALTSSVGAAGGMIGALVAPIAAALAGVAGAATQAAQAAQALQTEPTPLVAADGEPASDGPTGREDDESVSGPGDDDRAERDVDAAPETDPASTDVRAASPTPLLPPTVPSPAAPIRPPT